MASLGWYENQQQRIASLSFDVFTGHAILLVQVHGLELLNLKLKNIFGTINYVEYKMKAEFLDSFYSSIFAIMMNHCEKNKESFRRESLEVERDLDELIKKFKNKLFQKA